MAIAAPRPCYRWHHQPALTALQRNARVTWPHIAAVLVLLCIAAVCLPKLADWALCKAALRGSTAGWGVIAEKLRLSVLGRYPYPRQWRAAAATLLLISGRAVGAFTSRRWFPPSSDAANRSTGNGPAGRT
jgi:sirohydrochlorin ferrochelatase